MTGMGIKHAGLCCLFIVAAMSSASAAGKEKEKLPTYKQAVPSPICEPATDLFNRMNSCDDNKLFLEKAQECWARVKKLHEQVTADYKVVTGKNVAGVGQSQDFNTSMRDQTEAVAAHDYMLKVTEQALDDLDKYFDWVVKPDEELSDDEILNTDCYRDAVMPMDEIAEQMEDKIEEMKQTKGMEASMGKISGSRETNVGTIAPGSTVTGGKTTQGAPAKAPVKAGASARPANTITGVEQDKAKRQKVNK